MRKHFTQTESGASELSDAGVSQGRDARVTEFQSSSNLYLINQVKVEIHFVTWSLVFNCVVPE